MRVKPLFVTILALSPGLATAIWAQSAGPEAAEVALCDPYLNPAEDNNDAGDEEEAREKKTIRYDLEKADVLTSQEEIMAAVYEEKWDLASGAPVERFELCTETASYVVNWATVMGSDADGKPIPLAEGFLRLKKDGTFEFTFANRPYAGTWSVGEDAQMTLNAAWLNKGRPLVGPVEHVVTPVEFAVGEGEADSYNEEVYRIGPFRLLPVNTTVPGVVQTCACPVN